MENTEYAKVAPRHEARKSYRWQDIADGSWWRVRNEPDPPPAINIDRNLNDRARASARGWAKRHGYVMESRTERRGRALFIRFTRSGS